MDPRMDHSKISSELKHNSFLHQKVFSIILDIVYRFRNIKIWKLESHNSRNNQCWYKVMINVLIKQESKYKKG